MAGLAALAMPAVAYADASATVKAQTQRMSAPTLQSTQSGWYGVGTRLTLVCSARGQAVKGYFSPHLPGGWDNLWYKTSDGHFVADVDIETGTLNAVVRDCGAAPQPAPAVQSAPANGRPKGGTMQSNPLHAFAGYCTWGAQEKVRANAGYYISALKGNAEQWDDQARAAGWKVVADAQPRSIVVFERSLVGGVGHVAWVDAVNGRNVTITEINYGRGATAANGYRTVGFNRFTTRTVTDVPGMSYILVP
ncbi:CHAP domain-containing protein [Mycobacterium sp. ITM-2016-00316]|uniref:CHAP domain-containing protein n=1 Tax=Mycobacterium sp. ITM-2016-00316 TaxID=2099695 RepID=UPI001304F3B0|nr:CHAP domain-containing protein [Mycobacterium sp. ITM-2016-00316]WNG81163.1 CHAP domain-containing protein [Mycobacterium sp. ITM-2016-00316]